MANFSNNNHWSSFKKKNRQNPLCNNYLTLNYSIETRLLLAHFRALQFFVNFNLRFVITAYLPIFFKVVIYLKYFLKTSLHCLMLSEVVQFMKASGPVSNIYTIQLFGMILLSAVIGRRGLIDFLQFVDNNEDSFITRELVNSCNLLQSYP